MLYSSDNVFIPLNNVIHDPHFARLFLSAIDILENFVHFLQRLSGRLRNEEESEHEGEQTEDSEEGVGTVPSVLDERRCDKALIVSETASLYLKEGRSKLTTMKLLNQLEHVDKATPFARRDDGKISDGIAHGTGPHVAPKENI